jgi:arylsulfatase A-like enzyme
MQTPPAPNVPVCAPARGVADAMLAGIASGFIGGFAAGAIDAIASWQSVAQFVAEPAQRLRLIGFCGCAYALVGAITGLALAAASLALMRGTRLGPFAASTIAAQRRRQRRDPGAAVTALALALVAVPAVLLTASLAHHWAMPMLARRNPSLVVTVIMLATVAALLLAALLTLLVARPLEVALAKLARRPGWTALAAPAAPALAALALCTVTAIALLIREWETVRLLRLRPVAAAGGIAALALAAIPTVAALGRWARLQSSARRWLAVAATAATLVVGMLSFGSASAVIKAASAYTGLGGPIATVLRRGFDLDRDGYSRFLGGGDCDDGDRRIHPGAIDVPGDDMDQNCVAGDATAIIPAPDLGWAPVPAAVPGDASILLITIDTLRADHLGAYGYPRATSPALDRLAADGTVFEHSWAHAPSTRYSMPAILTGRLPLQVFYDLSVPGWPGLSQRATTIAEVLRPLGFVTGAITNYWYFDRSRSMDQGVDEYDNDNARLHAAVAGAGPAETRGSSSREQTDKAIAFVERHAGKRWFLWVHYYDPHYEYEAHPGSPGFGSSRIDLYDGEIRFTDDQIGRLFEQLRQRGLYDKTIIAVTGDHGEGFGEHGIDLHGYHLYAAQTRVPMIVRVPGLPARRSTTPVGHIDLLPTLANLVAADPRSLADAMGRSLVDLLSGSRDRDRVIWQQLSYEGNHELRGAISRDCHVLYNISPSVSWEVYRLDLDPAEQRDLAATDACSETRRALARWYDLSEVPAGAATALLAVRPIMTTTVDVDLGPAVRLLAVTMPTRARAGDLVDLEWTFEARGEPEPGWKVFVHVEGATRFTGDHTPVRPFEWWRRGQFIRYSTQLVIPRNAAPGAYTVWVGLWKGAQRMPAHSNKVRTEQDRAAVATFEIQP